MKPHWTHHVTTRAPFHISPIISYNSFQVQSTSGALEYFLCLKWNQPISRREQKFQTLNSSYHSSLSEPSPGPNHSVSITHNTDSSAFFPILLVSSLLVVIIVYGRQAHVFALPCLSIHCFAPFHLLNATVSHLSCPPKYVAWDRRKEIWCYSISSTNISALTLTRHLKIIFLSDSSLEILYIAPLFLLFLFFNWMMNTILSYKHINILFFVVKLSYIKWKVHWCLNSLAKFSLMLFISFCGSCGQRRDSLESSAQLSEQWGGDLGVIWSSL